MADPPATSDQAQFPARPYTGDQKAELEMDLQSGVPGRGDGSVGAPFLVKLLWLRYEKDPEK